MHKLPLYIFFITIIALIFGCKKNKDSIFLEEARKLAENNPTEALKFIDSIADPENSLNRKEYMQYLVAHTQVYYKNYLNIEDDSLIFEAVTYYKRHEKNPKQTALAYFYAGTVLRTQKKYDLAMEYYKNAQTAARKSLDSFTQGLIAFNIADLFVGKGLYDKALEGYYLASKYYKNHPEKRATALSSVGRMWLFKHNADSAFFYFHQGLKLAEDLDDIKLQRQLTESLAVAYEQVENFTESKKYLSHSLALNTDSAKLPRYHLNFALLYNKILARDSVDLYAQKLKIDLNTINDNFLRASILTFLIDYEKANQRLSAAFDYQADRMKVLTKIMEEQNRQMVYKIAQKYDYEQVKKQYYKSLSIKQGWIIILMGIIILGGVSFLLYRTKQRNKRLAIQSKIDTLTEMNLDLESRVQKKRSDLRRELLWRFDIAKKFIKLNEEISKKGKINTESGLMLKQFNTIVYGQSSLDEQWETLHQAFKQARPEYSEKIRALCPDMTETEFRICILTYADFSVKEIAIILQHSPNTIQTRRTSLRKKLGVPNGGDIADSIDRLFEQPAPLSTSSE